MNQVLAEYTFNSGVLLQLVQGDLTLEQVDAIVNAANAPLRHGGGLAGAIVRRGGPSIQAESDAWLRQHGPVTHDRPAYTGAGDLPCRYVIHAVGPVWGEGDEDNKLAAAVRGSLQVAAELGLASVALPAISTGIFGFPVERAAVIILSNIYNFFSPKPQVSLRLVRLVELDAAKLTIFRQAWASTGLESATA
jgi:O-acetyl-ADP-ribose deacetylase (regulator of RNase III)